MHAEARSRLIGTLLAGRYRVLDEIGRGGYGVVYRARDERLAHTVAVKVLDPRHLADQTIRDRFRGEADHLAPLNHPMIVSVLDVGEHDGEQFLVMQHIPGISLDAAVSGGPLPESEVIELGIQLASGLAAAHAQGLVHRDVKPANLRVTPDGWLKILDFGLAKWIQESTDSRDRHDPTGTHVVHGTLPYMAPEQLSGKPLDERVDIYATGAVLYELATGEPIFSRELPVEALHYLILNKAPKRPRLVNRKISAGLERIILRALEKDREKRYRTSIALQTDLKNLSEKRPRDWIKWSAAASLLAVGTTLVFLRIVNPSEPGRTWVAVMPFENLSSDTTQAYMASAITDEMINQLGTIRPDRLGAKDGASALTNPAARGDPSRIGRLLGVDYLLRGKVQREGLRIRVNANLDRVRDRSHVWGETYDENLSNAFELATRLADRIAQTAAPHLLGARPLAQTRPPTENSEAYEAYGRGREYWNRRNPEDLTSAIAYFERAIALDPGYARAHAGLADSYLLLASYGMRRPKEVIPVARAEAREAILLDESLPDAHTSLASVLGDYDWDWAGAMREFNRAIVLNPTYATAHQWYGVQLAELGHTKEALEQMVLARECDPLSPIISTDLAACYLNAHQYDRAIEQCQVTLDSLDSRFGLAYEVQGMAYAKQGRYNQAVDAFQSAALLEGGEAESVAALAQEFRASGAPAIWRWKLEQLRLRAQTSYVRPYSFASIHALLGDKDAAFAWLERAFQENDVSLVGLGVDVTFDTLRSDPRFPALLRRIGLPRR